ncbi:L,D-transpeptidase family protein [Nocardiopsis sp. CC223A]|uniref:L,D-transpeptidase family protein n=1 Tax=Nocardiopsis sp. CC223A TaxID=3044051 RepID=UPI00278C4D7C|nr:L,D-transpeptidase family protein [Nocardiopsis sp. CC223A]
MATPRTPSVPFLRHPARLLAVLLAALLGALLLAPPPARADARELRNGDSGRAVTALQEELLGLGYWLDGADGEFGPNTAQAVLALQKAAGIDRDGVVGPDTRAALADRVRPSAASSGDALEIDLERQLLLVVSGGEVEYTLSTSTGSGRPYLGADGSERIAVTPTGTYTVFRQVSGWDPGPYGALYAPMYFNGGIAVHGYPSVPAYPASHGCARVGLSAMDWLREEGHIAVGTTVVVR